MIKCSPFHRSLYLVAVSGFTAMTTASAQTTEYTYDELGRLIAVDYDQTATQDFIYDDVGNITEVDITAGGTGGVGFSVDDMSVTEGGNLVFTITKSGSTAMVHEVSYETSDSSAGAGDYTSVSSILSFGTSEISKTVTVSTIDDAVDEYDETLVLQLSLPTNGAILTDSQGVGTLLDNDAPPSFAVADASVTEGGTMNFTITKSGAGEKSYTLNYATANGAALSGSDYYAASGGVTFGPSETSKTIGISTINDAYDESSQAFYLNLSNPTEGATISDSQGVGTINDNDPGPSFSINNKSVFEGGSPTFTVTKSGQTERTHNVNYATANNTASSNDYVGKSGTLSFAPGTTTRSITINTVQDSAVEPTETFFINLSNATNTATISDSQGVGSIVNDDAPNNPPNAVNDYVTVVFPNAVNVYPLSNDTDPDGHTITLTSQSPGPGLMTTWYASQKRLRIEPTLTGNRYVNYSISDGNGGTDSGTIYVTVNSGGGGGGGGLPLF